MAYICNKPKNSCYGCEHYRFDDDRQRMACFAEYDEKRTVPIKASADKQFENREELFKLLRENPGLPVVPMVDGELVAGDEFGYWMGSWGSATVDEYLMPKSEWRGIHFKSDDDVFDVLEDWLTDEDFDALPENEKDCRPIYDALPWIKAIVVYITMPEH